MTIYTYGMAARGGRLTSVFGFSQMLHLAAPYGPVNFVGSASVADVAGAIADVPPGLGNKVVLAGYSWGACSAISAAMGLQQSGVPIDLLFLLVPPKAAIPPNVKRCVNHTVRGGGFLGWPSDIVSRESPDTVAVNYDYGSFLGMRHVAIQWNGDVHRSFSKELARLLT